MGKTDAILLIADSHLDNRIKRCILMNVTALKLEYAEEVREGKAKFAKQPETAVQIKKSIIGCSSTGSNTELGVRPLNPFRTAVPLWGHTT